MSPYYSPYYPFSPFGYFQLSPHWGLKRKSGQGGVDGLNSPC